MRDWLERIAGGGVLAITRLDAFLTVPYARLGSGRLRYDQALRRLRAAGIPTRADLEVGARAYVELRGAWVPGIAAVATAPGCRMAEVDTAGHGARGLPTRETTGREVTSA